MTEGEKVSDMVQHKWHKWENKLEVIEDDYKVGKVRKEMWQQQVVARKVRYGKQETREY